MSYFLASKDKHVADLASITGMSDMCFVVDRVIPNTALAKFLDTGVTTDIPNVQADIEFLLPRIKLTSVIATLKGLKENLSKCKGTAIICQ